MLKTTTKDINTLVNPTYFIPPLKYNTVATNENINTIIINSNEIPNNFISLLDTYSKNSSILIAVYTAIAPIPNNIKNT